MSIFEDELEAFEKLEKAFEQSVKALFLLSDVLSEKR